VATIFTLHSVYIIIILTANDTNHTNELPFSLRDTGLSLTTFNKHLKTFSVAFWDHGAFVTFIIYLRRS